MKLTVWVGDKRAKKRLLICPGYWAEFSLESARRWDQDDQLHHRAARPGNEEMNFVRRWEVFCGALKYMYMVGGKHRKEADCFVAVVKARGRLNDPFCSAARCLAAPSAISAWLD